MAPFDAAPFSRLLHRAVSAAASAEDGSGVLNGSHATSSPSPDNSRITMAKSCYTSNLKLSGDGTSELIDIGRRARCSPCISYK